MRKLDKIAIKSVMLKHLKSIGYPSIPNWRIVNELPILFTILDRDNLIPEGMTYKMFRVIAIEKYLQARAAGRP